MTQITSSPLSAEQLAEALTKVQQIVSERDTLRESLLHANRTLDQRDDRVALLVDELERTRNERDMYMRSTIKYATLIDGICRMGEEAKSVATAAMAAHDHLPGETEAEKAEAARVVTALPANNIIGALK